MSTRGRSGKDRQTKHTGQRCFRLAPIAQAIALVVAAGGTMGQAHASPAFSAAWFSDKTAIQSTARTTGMVNGKPISSFASSAGQQQQANAQLQQSIANLGLAAQGIAAQQAAQAAARQAAMNGSASVPDGLGAGGLDSGSLVSSWVNAKGPTQSTDANGKTVVDIQQTADKAIANWNTFNVGKNTIVQFDQQPDWAILNRVMDPTARPSQIEGQIKSSGTVMIVNRNGIVFSGTSQVNTRNLVAAAADISDSQFSANGIYGPNQTTASFTDANGTLLVEAGAQLTTNEPDSVTQGGGYVLLMGQQVSNAGDIQTHQGQTELAAGDSFIIRQGVGTDANTASTTRGNEIAPQFNANSTAGQVINTGLLLSREGDVTMAGHDVQQNGVAISTTTVNTRGTIHLLNSASDADGLVTLGDGAITAVVIEDDGTTTALDSQRSALITASAAQDLIRASTASGRFDNLSTLTDLEDESRIEIVSGGDVRFEGSSLTLATGGQIAVSAADRSLVAAGATLDVSGAVGVDVAMASNNVQVNVQGNELRDSPDNRDSGDLADSNVWIDRRNLILVPASADYPTDRWYTAGGLLEVSGYLDNQGHSIGEWAAQGGAIQLDGQEVVTAQGSQINLSGGSYNVQTGYLAQTWLVGSDGQLYNVDNAPANMTYDGIYKGYEATHPRWGDTATQYFFNPLIGPQQILENGYTVGRDAGQLIVNAPTAMLEGDIVATVYDGPQQSKARDAAADGYLQSQTAVAKPGTLSFGQYGPGGLNGVNNTDIMIGDIADVAVDMTGDGALPADRLDTTWLDAARLNSEGLGELDLATGKTIAIDEPLVLGNGGVLNMVAPVVSIDANVTARGGNITATNILKPGNGTSAVVLLNDGTAGIAVGEDALLDLRGLWTNLLLRADDFSGLAYLDGGNASFSSTLGIALESGSTIDVSSGGAVLFNGATSGGAGGNVSLVADAVNPVTGTLGDAPLLFDGNLRATGATGGGVLTLAAASVLVGDGVTSTVPDELVLPSSFFSTGFSNYDITGDNGVTVADGTQINVTEPVYRFSGVSRAASTGSDPDAAMDTWTPPLYLEDPLHDTLTQRAGASLALHGVAALSSDTGGAVTIGQGAAITVDPLQSITLQGHGQITVDGKLTAHGGDISLINDRLLGGGTAATSAGNYDPEGLSIWVGNGAVLDVSGLATTATDFSGRTYGTVIDGGAILLGTDQGGLDPNTGVMLSSDAFIVIRPQALLDASGANAVFDARALLGATATGPVDVASNGGSITMTSYDGIYADGTLRAAAGGAGAAGGTLSATLETPLYAFNRGSPTNPLRAPRTITISQSPQASLLPDGLAAGVNDPALKIGQAQFSADALAAGGFDNLSFSGRDAILFDGDVNLHAAQSISFYQGALADTRIDGHVTISAPYVLLSGSTGVKTDTGVYPTIQGLSSQPGTGTFAVSADLIDIGNTVRFGVRGTIALTAGTQQYDYAGFGDVDLLSQGDIRFLPGQITAASANTPPTALSTAGNLSFTAAQLYPITGAVAQVSAGVGAGNVSEGNLDPDSVIDINRISDADPAQPDSVFGKLTMAAGTIDQGGIVRAPLGSIFLGATLSGVPGVNGTSEAVNLLPGSITSTSANGLTIPYGGTTDGVTYAYNGATVEFPISNFSAIGDVQTGVSLAGATISVASGAVIDVSGGGNLTGAGFVSGRGGSVDVLNTALATANPSNTFSAPNNQVYAIVPGYTSGYAPVDGGAEGAAPGIGQQVTIPSGVPGLPAGTYTLLPARYALLSGAYRIELGKAGGSVIDGAVATGTGSYLVSGERGVANTGIESALPSQMVLTPGAAVRDYSQYNEMGYSDFAVQQAATLSQMVPELPADGGLLALLYSSLPGTTAPALTFQGKALFQGAAGGRAGTAIVSIAPSGNGGAFEIVSSQPTPDFSGFSFDAADLNAIGASRLIVGGWEGIGSDITFNPAADSVTVRNGVDLSAAEVFLMAKDGITLDPGAEIDTIGKGAAPFDFSDGYVYDATGAAVLAVSNGNLNFINSGAPSIAPISIGAGAQIYSEGTISFSTGGEIAIDPTVRFGTRNLGLNVGTINVGDTAGMAGAVVPPGLLLSQDFLNRLLAGDTSVGAPALQTLTLSASQSFNVFGSVDLNVIDPATGKADLDLVLNTPAIYGYGSAGDEATLTVGTLTWSGIAKQTSDGNSTTYQSMAPGSIVAGGPGTGSGTFDIIADKIILGYPDNAIPNNTVTLDRAIVGFSTVNLQAGEIDANNKNTLTVYQALDAGGAGTGGNLNLLTPLLTAEAGSIMAYAAGGALTVAPPAGSAAGSAAAGALGGEIDLTAASVAIDSTILLPSGKFSVTADGDISLQAGSRLDLAGQATPMFDQTIYSFGGDVTFESTNGNIVQQAGSVIDVSAVGNNAGSLAVTAIGTAGGQVSLDGTLLGASTPTANTAGKFADGAFSVSAQTLAGGSAASLGGDFSALNDALTRGGFFDTRSFDFKQGDLTIGDDVKAHDVTVSVDGGSLTVAGTIDASGTAPGTIRLAAIDTLTLLGSAVLDAHGTVLQTDSYGQPIDAENQGVIELTATHGLLALNAGAAIDLSAPDGVARGEINLNVSRTGETSGDLNIVASDPLSIKGAQSIAVNGFWTYSPTDAHGTIVQDNGDTAPVAASGADTGFVGMNQVDAQSQAFIAAAYNNNVAAGVLTPGLQGKLTGLASYGSAFHLRPGVEIDGRATTANPNGDLTVAGDLDLSGFRYGPNADRNPLSPTYGAGEPGALVMRAGGNLDVVGSISDGFSPAPASPDDNDWAIAVGVQTSNVETLLPIEIDSGTTFPNTTGLSLRYDIPIEAATIRAGVIIPLRVTLSTAFTIPAGTRLTAPIFDSLGNQIYASGSVMTVATMIPAGSQLGSGSVMPGNIAVAAMTWTAGMTLGVFADAVTLSSNVVVPFEGIVPSGANVVMADAIEPTRPTGPSGAQGSNEVLAPMLPQGDLSWSLRLVSGAALDAADTRAVKPASELKASGASGNLTLSDRHFSHGAASTKYFYYYYTNPKRIYVSDPNNYSCTHYGNTACHVVQFVQINGVDPSVVRTGTGDTDLIAGGSFNEDSLYGVYTAGTQSPALGVDGSANGVTEASNPYNLPRGTQPDGTLLGAANPDYNSASAYQAWYPEHGGNVLVSAQGNMTGNIAPGDLSIGTNDSNLIGDWLWRQGGAIAGQPAAWWISFGAYVIPLNAQGSLQSAAPVLTGFTGIGTLGGGNLTILAGGDAGTTPGSSTTGLNATVASTGRVLADGTLVQTGGGDLTVRIGGALNTYADQIQSDTGGVFADLRGDTAISAGSIGVIQPLVGVQSASDPRFLGPLAAGGASETGGIIIAPGDSTVDISTRGDLVLAGVGDPGRSAEQNTTSFTASVDGVTTSSSWGGYSSFTLWTDSTAVNLYAAGGNLTPSLQSQSDAVALNDASTEGGRFFFPASLSVVAASGDIYFSASTDRNGNLQPLELAPSPQGQLNILAAGSILGGAIDISGADPSTVATPFNPAFTFAAGPSGNTVNNTSPDSYAPGVANTLLAFGPDTATGDLHANDPDPARIYAVSGDIVGLQFGEVLMLDNSFATQTLKTWYIGAKSASIRAGGDIVGLGAPYTAPVFSGEFSGVQAMTVPGFILNANPNDISTVSAGGDILFSSMQVAGPGLLDVEAGRNVYEADKGTLQSIGPIFDVNQANRDSGAGITVMAGVGAAGPDYSGFARLYFNAANQADAAIPDTDPANAGKVPVTYQDQLFQWLQQRFGYAGSEADAQAYFLALPSEQQGVFVRQVYFDELNASGLEFNDPSSKRFQSYLRGRDAIAALFPNADAQGNPIGYTGDITLFGDAGIHTDFGGTIQTLTPGGATLVGVEGANPPGTAGVVTQGSGDIDMYSLGSILLGQSRVMTTFGGNILAWSATGDINAGRGSKTTQVFTPPRLDYDDYGDVTLSPDVPTSGAGFATLDPIPEVPPGDMNLVAPLGTIDAGEAGIRVSGNINLAALQVINAANIQVQGKSTGLPVVASVNVGALTSASAAASQAATAAENVVRQQQAAARQALPSIITVTVLGFGSEPVDNDATPPPPKPSGLQSSGLPYDAAKPLQFVGVDTDFDPRQTAQLTDDERRSLQQDRQDAQ